MDANIGVQIFSIIASSVTAIVVAIFGVISARKERHDKQYRKLREELEEQKRIAAEKERQEREAEIENLSKRVDELSKIVTKMNESLSESVQTIDTISKLTKHSLEFSNEINNVLMVLSETIIASHPNDKSALRNQMKEHRARTKELMNNLYQITL